MKKNTISKINAAIHSTLSRSINFLTYKKMTLFFIKEYTGFNAFQADFQDLINECNKHPFLKINYSYSSEEEFYRMFCKNKLNLSAEPQQKYFEIRNTTLERIKNTEDRLTKLHALRANAKGKIPTIKNIENYNENYSLISFYIDKNKKALNEMNAFLVHEIEKMAISRCLQLPYLGILSIFPFDTLFPQDTFLNLKAQSILGHRYGDLSVPKANNIFNLYDKYLNNESAEYIVIPSLMIEYHKIFDKILSLCNEHHILKKRTQLIKKCITCYTRKEYQLIVVLIPAIIEGFINDVCIMYGQKKEDIYQYGFSKKINFIQTRHHSKDFDRSLYSLDYFRYFFPSIRNHMAHGWIEKSKEIEVLAGHLMLDLFSACKIVTKADYKMNMHISCIKKLSHFDGSNKQLINDYLGYLNNELQKSPCDPFYKLGNIRKKLNSLYFKNTFINTVVDSINSDKNQFELLCRKISSINNVANKNDDLKYSEASQALLKKARIRFKEKCEEAAVRREQLRHLLSRD